MREHDLARLQEVEALGAVDGRPGDERPVGDDPQPVGLRLRLLAAHEVARALRPCTRRRARSGGRLPAGEALGLGGGEPAVDGRRVGRQRCLELATQLAQERELRDDARRGRERRAKPLHPALEVRRRALLLERRRRGQDHVGPAGRLVREQRRHDDGLGALQRAAPAVGVRATRHRIGVAEQHQHLELAALGAVEDLDRIVAEAGRANPELVRRLGQGQDTARLVREPALLRDPGDQLQRLRIGDEQHRALGSGQPVDDRIGAVDQHAGCRLDALAREQVELRPARAHQHEARAPADRLADAQLDHAGEVPRLAVAGDHDHVGRVEVGDRRAVGVEQLPRPAAAHERAAAGGLHDLAPGEGLLVRLLAGCDHRDRAWPVEVRVVAQPACDGLGRGLPRRLVEPAIAPHERGGVPVVCADVVEREAPLVAEPALVDVGPVARQHAPYPVLAHRRPGVAAGRAEAADRRDVVDLPRPRLETVARRRQRAHRAELGHVPAERARVRALLEGGDDRPRSALARDQELVLGDVRGEPRAAVAEDAALAVERDQRRDRYRLLVRALGQHEARVARSVAEGQVLQRALAALVADRAVERVVDQQELEHRPLRVGCALVARVHLHAVGRGHRARGLQLRHSLDLDEAHPARADRGAETGLVTEDRDLDAVRSRREDERRALRHDDLSSVDLEADGVDLGRAHDAATRGSRRLGLGYSDRRLDSGHVQPPWRTCSSNSSRKRCTNARVVIAIESPRGHRQ